MPLNLFYTMVQKSQKWPKTQIKGGGSCLNRSFLLFKKLASFFFFFFDWACFQQNFLQGRWGPASIVRQLNLLFTHFSCILGMDRTKALIFLTVFETKNEMHSAHVHPEHSQGLLSRGGVLVHMPFPPSLKVHWSNSMCFPPLVVKLEHGKT